MNRRTRMFCTLAAVTFAMTGAAVVLSYFDPYPGSDRSITPEAATRLARTLVRDDVVVDRSSWRGVEIIEAPEPPGGAVLAASADPTESHFYVDDRGRLSRSARWRRQTAAAAAPNMIRIQVSPRASSEGLSPAQWYAVQALLDVIDENVRGGTRPLPIYASDHFQQVQFFTPLTTGAVERVPSAG